MNSSKLNTNHRWCCL